MKGLRAAAATILCVALAASAAHADDQQQEAEKHFQAGVALQKVDDFAAAISAFEASLRLYPTKAALFNLANCLRAVHRYADALDALERLQREWGDRLEEPMRTAVAEQIAQLNNLTSTLIIEVDQPGAEVRVDGAVVGQSPLNAPLRLSPGEHSIEVTLEGYEPARARVTLAPRDQTTERVELRQPPPEPIASPAPVTEPKRPAAPPATGPSALGGAGWITTSTGIGLLAAGAATGAWALSIDGDLQDECSAGRCPETSRRRIERLDALAVTTNVLLGVGLTATAAGILMLVLDSPPGDPPADQAQLGFSVGPGFVGAGLQQRF